MLCGKTTMVLCVLCTAFFSVYAADATKTTGESSASSDSASWVLAARKFTFSNNYIPDAAAQAAAEDIPRLILEKISSGSRHAVSPDESTARKLAELQKKRLALFLELSKEYLVRDSLVLKYTDRRSLQHAIAEQEKKTADIEKQISENLAETEKYLPSDGGPEPGICNPDSHTSAGRGHDRPMPAEPASEPITLYKNDTAVLFTAPEKAGTTASYTFQKAVSDAGIRGLISGSITVYGKYAAVSVDLQIFPGGASAGAVTEIGVLSDTMQIADSISRVLIPKIINSMPVHLFFEVTPENADAVVMVDGVVIPSAGAGSPSSGRRAVVDSGIHTVTFTAEGYHTVQMQYAFTDRSAFRVSVKMKPKTPGKITIGLPKTLTGMLYTDVVTSIALDGTADYMNQEPLWNGVTIDVNGSVVVGQIVDDQNNILYFYVPEELSKDGTITTLRKPPYDVSADIEKHRRRMYTAYSTLILSLPVSFYAYGRFSNYYNSARLGGMDFSEANVWRNRTWVALGVSVTLGVVFGYQLIRYLMAADHALPEEVKKE